MRSMLAVVLVGCGTAPLVGDAGSPDAGSVVDAGQDGGCAGCQLMVKATLTYEWETFGVVSCGVNGRTHVCVLEHDMDAGHGAHVKAVYEDAGCSIHTSWPASGNPISLNINCTGRCLDGGNPVPPNYQCCAEVIGAAVDRCQWEDF